MTTRKQKPIEGIPISDRTGDVVRFLTASEGDDGPRKVVRQYLELEELKTRNQRSKTFTGFDARLAPLADKLESLQREVDELIATSRGTNLRLWEDFVRSKPPSAAAIALMLVFYDRELRVEGVKAVQAKERARTTRAREVIVAKAAAGETFQARATEILKAIRQRGDSVMDRNVAKQIAERLGCDAATVRNARNALLKRK